MRNLSTALTLDSDPNPDPRSATQWQVGNVLLAGPAAGGSLAVPGCLPSGSNVFVAAPTSAVRSPIDILMVTTMALVWTVNSTLSWGCYHVMQSNLGWSAATVKKKTVLLFHLSAAKACYSNQPAESVLQCKGQFARSGQILEFHILPLQMPPLHSAARGGCPPPSSFPPPLRWIGEIQKDSAGRSLKECRSTWSRVEERRYGPYALTTTTAYTLIPITIQVSDLFPRCPTVTSNTIRETASASREYWACCGAWERSGSPARTVAKNTSLLMAAHAA